MRNVFAMVLAGFVAMILFSSNVEAIRSITVLDNEEECMDGKQNIQTGARSPDSARSTDLEHTIAEEGLVAVEGSNMAGIGSDEDHALRKEAAETEEAWQGCGMQPGIEIWRIEQFKVVPVPREQYGSFYRGDSYIVLKTFQLPETEELLHHIYFWLGSQTSVDEQGTAAYKTVELDDYFDGEPVQHRETEGHESPAFHTMFPNMKYLEGGVDSGFHHVGTEGWIARLLEVRKEGGVVRTTQLPLSRDSMSEHGCFLLDAGTKIFWWYGSMCGAFSKQAAGMEALALVNQRFGRAKSLEWRDDPEEFWGLLGGRGPISADPPEAKVKAPVGEGILYKLSNEYDALIFAEEARGDLSMDMLSSEDVFIVDTMKALFVWIGSDASEDERREAVPMALQYLEKSDRPSHTPIKVLKEGHEDDLEWKKFMS